MAVYIKVLWFCWNWASNIGFVIKHGPGKTRSRQGKCKYVQYSELLYWCSLGSGVLDNISVNVRFRI